ncbi:GMC family oxidoreductase [Demequina muriae]|uniref:GMC family oxidoreductase n=1 Tax=Demequina muriae TaxID=3051664 RepID=A0ABT8GGT3_9MICO|nr:GMC family oxidoreductase [Demequina sp. EGI L300058]MDN4480644.1 GMC family oxidoreductase [Demequina sp. EGI L300058]
MTHVDDDVLAAWVAAVVPEADVTVSAPPVAARLAAILTDDHPGGTARFAAMAARIPAGHAATRQDDVDVRWFARLAARVHLADSRTWRGLGWRPSPMSVPEGSDIADEVIASLVGRAELRSRYDAVVIGSGAGGSVAAQEYAEAGLRVLVIERGHAPPTHALARDHLRNPRADAGLDVLTGPSIHGNPRVLGDGTVVTSADPRWGNNAMTLGGGTRVYGGQAWRFSPDDFRMASTYGVPEGSALADWPVSYQDMERYYAHAEFEWGVSGAPGDPATEGVRSSPYPLPPMPRTPGAHRLKEGADALGWETLPVPLLVNSEPYRGRAACVRCAQCVGFACPVGAKAGAQNTTLQRAARTGRLSILVGAQAVRLTTDRTGRVTGVALRSADPSARWDASVEAEQIVLAAGAVESARLLLASAHSLEPTGVGNAHDQVGRHLQAHIYAGALGIFADRVEDGTGPGPAIATNDFRHGNPDVVGGGMLANDFVPTPASALGYLQDAGLIPHAGPGMVSGLRDLAPRMQRVVGPVHEVTTADARVTLDARVTDHAGMPVARLSGEVHPEDLRAQRFLTERAEEWLRSSGATTVVPMGLRRPGGGPSVGQHQAGTCRMGDDPGTSVVDPLGRVWGHDNLRVVDASVHVTNGGVNPVLTVIANAYRIMDAAVGVREADEAYSE